jgi:hypothetical protein
VDIHDPTPSMLRAVIRDDAGRHVDVQRFFHELSAPARAAELLAEHEVVASMVAEIRAQRRDDGQRSARHSAFRAAARVVIVTGTIVMTAGSSLALVGGLPAPLASWRCARSAPWASLRHRDASRRQRHR